MENTPIKSTLFIDKILSQANEYCGDFRKTLYHYTNAEGLKGIINDGEIWGTHYKFTNDHTEYVCSYIFMTKILEKYIEKEKDSRIKPFFETFLTWNKKYIELEKCYSSNILYFASFSEEKDLPNQWEKYGDNSLGYCIGIDLYKIDRISAGLSFQTTTKLIKIIYKKEEQEVIISNFLDKLKNYIEENNQLNMDPNWLFPIYQTIFTLIASSFKDLKHKEEREWRLIYDPIVITNNDEFKKDEYIINYRTNNKVIIPYVKMNIKNETSNLIPVNKIILGPRSDETKARMGLQIFLKDKGYPDDTISKIHKSKIPYFNTFFHHIYSLFFHN